MQHTFVILELSRANASGKCKVQEIERLLASKLGTILGNPLHVWSHKGNTQPKLEVDTIWIGQEVSSRQENHTYSFTMYTQGLGAKKRLKVVTWTISILFPFNLLGCVQVDIWLMDIESNPSIGTIF